MTNNKKSSVDYLISQLQKSKDWHRVLNEVSQMSSARVDIIAEAKAMQQEQAQLYASFVLKCVQNNLPPITFNDWINLGNNEEQ